MPRTRLSSAPAVVQSACHTVQHFRTGHWLDRQWRGQKELMRNHFIFPSSAFSDCLLHTRIGNGYLGRNRHLSFSVMPAKAPPKPLKILMLHGYTQNGPLFHAKTKVLEKHLQKNFPGSTFNYPTGPLGLKPSDVPGFDPSQSSNPDDIQAYGWWRRSNTADPPEYVGLDEGLRTVSDILSSEGPFDGVIGFSQGAALAAMICSLLEGQSRHNAFEQARAKSDLAISFPASFDTLQHPPMKFCVPYCGFVAPGDRYTAFYQNPVISTPSCHFVGNLDSVVEESRTQALVDACGGVSKAQVVTHPGGHFVPSGKRYLDAVASFINTATTSDIKKPHVVEERAEDMDVPF